MSDKEIKIVDDNELYNHNCSRSTMTPMEIISSAVQSGASPEQLGQLLALQERFEANEAKKAFDSAMAAFKANPPKLVKDKRVNFTSPKGTTDYRHAALDQVSGVIGAALSKHGLSHRWRTSIVDGGAIEVACTIAHASGHSEELSVLRASPDVTGNKNSIQAVGSTSTYLQRYTLLAATGLATGDMDDDARFSEECISEEQRAELDKALDALGANKAAFCEYMGVESLAKIPVCNLNIARGAIEAKRRNGGGS